MLTIISRPIKPYNPFWARSVPRSLKRSKPLIGLDIGSHSITLVQLEILTGRYHVQCYGVKSLPHRTSEEGLFESGKVLAETIRSLFRENGIDDTQVACSIRGPAVMVKSIQVPTMSMTELKEHLALEVDQYLPSDVTELYWDYHIQNFGEKAGITPTMSVLLVAAKKEAVHQRIDLLQNAGLDPLVVDVDALALSNMFTLNYHDQAQNGALLISISPSGLDMILMYEKNPVYLREVSIGGDWYRDLFEESIRDRTDNKRVAEVESCGPWSQNFLFNEVCSEIKQEVKKTIEYCLDTILDHQIETVFLCGGYSWVLGLVEHLEAEVKLPVKMVDPFRSLEISAGLSPFPSLQNMTSVAGVAVGLALRGVGK